MEKVRERRAEKKKEEKTNCDRQGWRRQKWVIWTEKCRLTAVCTTSNMQTSHDNWSCMVFDTVDALSFDVDTHTEHHTYLAEQTHPSMHNVSRRPLVLLQHLVTTRTRDRNMATSSRTYAVSLLFCVTFRRSPHRSPFALHSSSVSS